MTAKKNSLWRLDFAGRHGTGWGAFNLGLTVVSITTLERVLFAAPWWWAAVAMGCGILGTLFAVAFFRKRETPPATVAYQLACWMGGGVWSAWMLSHSHWTLCSWGIGIAILAGGTFFAGILVWLGSEDKPEAEKAQEVDLDAQSQRARNALGGKYEEIIHRLAGNRKDDPALIEVVALEQWSRGGGHTVEGRFISGKFGLVELQRLAPKIALDLGLDEGCGVEISELKGGSRKVWLMDVTTRDALAEGAPYPVDTAGPYSINGMIPVGMKPSGEPIGPCLRQRNMAIEGMPGSGKTGGLQATVGSLALTADCQLWGWDATGADLIQPFQRAFLAGDAQLPVFASVATTYDEGAEQMRAMLRISYARKMGYGYLKAKYDDPLLRMGAVVSRSELELGAQAHFPIDAPDRLLPQIMWVGDETTGLLRSRNQEHPDMSGLVAKVMQETRGSGERVIVPPLGGDDKYISQSFQKLIHTIVALRMENPSEYKLALGNTYSVDPKDISLEGTGLWRDAPGASLERFRFYGPMKQSVVDRIAIRADKLGTLPDLDFISELAANGYMPDGSSWPADGVVMKEGDAGWWDRRWEKIMGGTTAHIPTPSRPVRPASAPRTGTTMTMDEIRSKVNEVNAAADERIAEVRGVSPEEVRIDREELEIAAQANWSTIPDWLPAIPTAPAWQEQVMEAIRNAGQDGAQMQDLVELAGKHRDTVHNFLKPKVDARQLWKPKDGRYAICPDEQ